MRLAVLAALALPVLRPGAAAGEGAPACAPRAVVIAHLAERYGETRQSVGMDARGAMVETFASARTGSWSILATGPSGTSCLMASGEAFENLAEPPAPPGEDI